MAQCEGCGKKPTLAYNRMMRFLPHERRLYCEDCFASLQRREDIIFFAVLLGIFFTVTSAILGIHFINKSNVEKELAQIDAYYEVKDLNKDGRIDYWEESATEKMRMNFQKIGYPYNDVLGSGGQPGSRLRFIVNRSDFLDLSKKENFFKNFHFADLMKSHFEKITSPDSNRQLFRVFVTQDNSIVFFIHEYESVPEGGFTAEHFLPAPKDDEASEDTEKQSVERIEPVNTLVCLENLTGDILNEMMGLSTGEYHIDNHKLTPGPDPKDKKKKK